MFRRSTYPEGIDKIFQLFQIYSGLLSRIHSICKAMGLVNTHITHSGFGRFSEDFLGRLGHSPPGHPSVVVPVDAGSSLGLEDPIYVYSEDLFCGPGYVVLSSWWWFLLLLVSHLRYWLLLNRVEICSKPLAFIWHQYTLYFWYDYKHCLTLSRWMVICNSSRPSGWKCFRVLTVVHKTLHHFASMIKYVWYFVHFRKTHAHLCSCFIIMPRHRKLKLFLLKIL